MEDGDTGRDVVREGSFLAVFFVFSVSLTVVSSELIGYELKNLQNALYVRYVRRGDSVHMLCLSLLWYHISTIATENQATNKQS